MKPYGKTDRIFFVAVVLIHSLFYLLALHYQRFFNGDSFEYIQEAFNIKEHFFFYSGNPALAVTEEYMTLRTPGYPLFLLLIYAIAVSNKLVLFFQNIVSIFNIIYARKALMQLGYQKKYDWLLLLFIVAFPSQFIYANTIAPDILLQTFVLIYFYQALNFLQKKSVSSAFKMSLALTIGLFIKPVLYPFAFINLIVVLAYAFAGKKNFKLSLIAALIPVVSIMSYNFWNYNRTGKFHFTSIQSFNAIYYYHQYFSAKNGAQKARTFVENERAAIESKPTFAKRYDEAHNRGIDLLKQQPASYLSFHLKKSLFFFFETGKGEIDMFTGKLTLGNLYAEHSKSFKQIMKEKGVSAISEYLQQYPSFGIALLVLLFNIVKAAGLILFAVYVRMQRVLKWFVFLFIAYFALITGPISNAHYVLPVALIISVAAVIGCFAFLQRKQNSSIIML